MGGTVCGFLVEAEKGVCLQCGFNKATIKRRGISCGWMSGGEEPELVAEFPKHRFKPWTDKELTEMYANEKAELEQMQGFVEFCNKQSL